MQLEIIDNGKRIATFLFYVISRENGIDIHINNIQGINEGYLIDDSKVRSPKKIQKSLANS